MNILFLTLSKIYDLRKRGLYIDLMNEIVNRGHNVYIVVPFERKSGKKTKLYVSEGAHILGVKTLNIQKTNVLEKGIGTLLLQSQYYRAVKKYIHAVEFDLVLYSTPPITFNKVISTVKRKYNSITYLLLKDIFPQNAVDLGMFSKCNPIYKFFRSKEKKLYSISDFIGCMSPANVKYLLRNNPEISVEKVEVCPNSINLISQKDNGVDKINKVSLYEKYNIPQNKVVCLYGGNLGKPQGIDFLIEAIEHNEKRNNCFFLIVGSGTEYGRLKRWFDSTRPQNSLLYSALPKYEYDKLVQLADIGLIFLDHRFTIPNYPSRILTYMENKLPIMMAVDLNTDIGRIAEENKYGLWSESNNIKDFNEKLAILIDNERIRKEMGENGYRYLLEYYTVEKSVDIILNHFSN